MEYQKQTTSDNNSTAQRMSDDEKLVHICLAVGALENVRSQEFDENPKSRRSRILDNILERCLAITDMYGMDDWELDKISKAWGVLDVAELWIKEHFVECSHDNVAQREAAQK